MASSIQSLALGGGCFWCTEAVFVKVRGVTDVESGYSNGSVEHPTYEQVCSGFTGHNEVVKLEYDPAQITLREILEIFFLIHDPTTLNRQGNDVGTQYRSAIYYSTPEQKEQAEAMVREVAQHLAKGQAFGRKVVTEVLALANYWPAEGHHQDFFEKNPAQGYCLAVAAPKVEKFRKTFADRVRS